MDLSYILNSPDVERVAAALETIAGKTVEAMNGKVDKNQGTASAGKALVVGSDGVVTTGDAGIPDAVKTALLTLMQHVAYADSNGSVYYNALQSALYPSAYPKIVATYTPGSHVVYTDDALSTLKPYLSVVYYETEESIGTVVTAYTLTGTLIAGDSTILVIYNGYMDKVTVTAVDYYSIARRTSTDDTATKQVGTGEMYEDDGIRYARIKTSQTTREVIGTTRGYVPMVDYNGNQLAIYPVPVPVGAKTLTVSYTPSTGNVNNMVYVAMKLLKADGRYRMIQFMPQTVNGASVTIYEDGAPADAFVNITIFDSTGSNPDATAWTISFGFD